MTAYRAFTILWGEHVRLRRVRLFGTVIGIFLALGLSTGAATADTGSGGVHPNGSLPGGYSTLTAADRPSPDDGDATARPFVVDGTLADSSRGMAAVLVNGDLNCSGSIVDNRWVLTAKHCVMYDSNGNDVPDTKYPVSSLSVRVKSLHWASGGGVVGVSLTKVRTDNDIAMLKLDRSANAEPVRMASANAALQAEVYAFGWGSTCASCNVSPVLKRAVGYVFTISTDLFGGEALGVAAGNPPGGGAVCYGDSGGPLFKLVDGKRYQVGVLSNGSKSCVGPDNFSSVPRSKAWIEGVMADF